MKKLERSWGYELFWAENSLYYGKTLLIMAGKNLPKQRHQVKDKTFRVQKGTIRVEVKKNDGSTESLLLDPGESCRIESGIEHQIFAIVDSEIVEVSTPDEDDIELFS